MQSRTLQRTTVSSALICLITALHCTWACALPAFILSAKDKPPCPIIIATNASPSERYAAEELQKYLERITGVKPPIIGDSCRMGTREILLGDNQHVRKLGI